VVPAGPSTFSMYHARLLLSRVESENESENESANFSLLNTIFYTLNLGFFDQKLKNVTKSKILEARIS
jgi:hypothetical protein